MIICAKNSLFNSIILEFGFALVIKGLILLSKTERIPFTIEGGADPFCMFSSSSNTSQSKFMLSLFKNLLLLLLLILFGFGFVEKDIFKVIV